MTNRLQNRLAAVLFALCSISSSAIGQEPNEESPAEWVVDLEDSLFSIVTHKGGAFAGKAHDHIVTAPTPEITLAFDPDAPTQTRMQLLAASASLMVDEPKTRERHADRIVALGILEQEPSEVKASDREKIYESMTGRKQLDIERFPQLAARVLSVRKAPTQHGDVDFPWAIELEVEIHGRSVTSTAAARYLVLGSHLEIEAVGELTFTSFGIKPYSAFLGAVKNLDPFHVYVRLSAERR